MGIAELQASAQIKQATGEGEAIRLRATGESEAMRLKGDGEAAAVRAVGTVKAEAHRAGVDALGVQDYTALQLMQLIGDRNVRIVPDVSVTGSGAGLAEGLLAMLMRGQSAGKGTPAQ